MSVRKGERNKNKLEVLNAYVAYTDYVISMCANDKIIPKSKRFIYAYKIIDECIEAEGYITAANEIRYIRYPIDYELRREYQLRALSSVGKINRWLDRAYVYHHIPGNKIDFSQHLLEPLLELLNGWIKSDEETYGNLLG